MAHHALPEPPEKGAPLDALVSAAQRVAGVVAARGRGDRAGASQLLRSLDQQELGAGALLVADLALNLLGRESGQSLDQAVARLCVEVEQALAS